MEVGSCTKAPFASAIKGTDAHGRSALERYASSLPFLSPNSKTEASEAKRRLLVRSLARARCSRCTCAQALLLSPLGFSIYLFSASCSVDVSPLSLSPMTLLCPATPEMIAPLVEDLYESHSSNGSG
ncbi:hypothetical protein GDO81_025870 [Engystomops pustulosus]|uniref:Uncharacterized protein n=1 Tax=Engystomops pustulosus TaxID=76066 RepID=A0AAV6YGN5_ENGPU|nr:hypothetical protein GDO81_025870 [Engystomops pustulosus]